MQNSICTVDKLLQYWDLDTDTRYLRTVATSGILVMWTWFSGSDTNIYAAAVTKVLNC